MRKYFFTEAAPSKVGGQPNTGVGTEVEYADGFADAYVAMGWLIDKEAAANASAEADAAEAEAAAAEQAAKEAAEKEAAEAAEKAAAEEKAKAEAEAAAAQKKAGKKAGETGGAGA